MSDHYFDQCINLKTLNGTDIKYKVLSDVIACYILLGNTEK